MSKCFLTTTQRPIQHRQLTTNSFWKNAQVFTCMGANVDINFPVATCNPLNDETLGGNHMDIINDVQGAIQWPMHPNPHHIQDCGTWCNWPNMRHTKNQWDAQLAWALDAIYEKKIWKTTSTWCMTFFARPQGIISIASWNNNKKREVETWNFHSTRKYKACWLGYQDASIGIPNIFVVWRWQR